MFDSLINSALWAGVIIIALGLIIVKTSSSNDLDSEDPDDDINCRGHTDSDEKTNGPHP